MDLSDFQSLAADHPYFSFRVIYVIASPYLKPELD